MNNTNNDQNIWFVTNFWNIPLDEIKELRGEFQKEEHDLEYFTKTCLKNYYLDEDIEHGTRTLNAVWHNADMIEKTTDYTKLADLDLEKPPLPAEPVFVKDEFPTLSVDNLSKILSQTIVQDEATKRILFLGMLMNYCGNSQQNLGFQGPSSSGKTYISQEIAKYFPMEDVREYHYMSPQALFHAEGTAVEEDGITPLIKLNDYISNKLIDWEKDNPRPDKGEGIKKWNGERNKQSTIFKGEWNDKPKGIRVDLRQKILIFLDQPHHKLLEKLRPVLSHDSSGGIMESQIVDKTSSGEMKTKRIFIVGYPTVLFLSVAMAADEQEQNRMWLLSASSRQEKIKASIDMLSVKMADQGRWKKAIEESKPRKKLMARIIAIKKAMIQDVIIDDDIIHALKVRFLNDHKNLMARAQRDFPRLINIIKAHSLFNMWQREISDQIITATQEDVDAGYVLYAEVSEANELGLPPAVWSFWQEILEKKLEIHESMTYADLRSYFFEFFGSRLSTQRTSDFVKNLESVDLIEVLKDPTNKTRNILVKRGGTEISNPLEGAF